MNFPNLIVCCSRTVTEPVPFRPRYPARMSRRRHVAPSNCSATAPHGTGPHAQAGLQPWRCRLAGSASGVSARATSGFPRRPAGELSVRLRVRAPCARTNRFERRGLRSTPRRFAWGAPRNPLKGDQPWERRCDPIRVSIPRPSWRWKGRPSSSRAWRCCARKKDKPDAIAVVDTKKGSKTYGKAVHKVELSHLGDELHHFGWTPTGRRLLSCRRTPPIRPGCSRR